MHAYEVTARYREGCALQAEFQKLMTLATHVCFRLNYFCDSVAKIVATGQQMFWDDLQSHSVTSWISPALVSRYHSLQDTEICRLCKQIRLKRLRSPELLME